MNKFAYLLLIAVLSLLSCTGGTPAITPPSDGTPAPVPVSTSAIKFTAPKELLPRATIGDPYSFSFATATNPSGGNPPYTFMLGSGVGSPPFGLILDVNGLLNGTPTAAGTREFEVCVKDLSGNQDCATTSLTVEQGQHAFTGLFSGTGDFTRPFPASDTSCTWSNTYSGTIDLTVTLESDKTYAGSVSVLGTYVSTAISGGHASFECLDSSISWDSTNQISGTLPDIIWSTSFVTPGGTTVTGYFSGTLSGSSITGNMLITMDTSTGLVSIPITFTEQ